MPPLYAQINGMTAVPKEAVRSPLRFETALEDELVFKIKKGEFSGAKVTYDRVCLYHSDKEYYYVPRHWNWQEYTIPLPSMDCRTAASLHVPMRFTGTLSRSPDRNQVEAVNTLLACDSGILACSPGKGKTVMALAAMSEVPARRLVAVPTTYLLHQWVEKACEFTDLTKDDIGIVQGGVCEYRHPLVIGMLPSLAQTNYDSRFYGSFGVFVADEVHRFGAATWLGAIPRFNAMKRWGLSATVDRKDGMHKAFMLHMGPVVYRMFSTSIVPVVNVIHTGVRLPEKEYTNVWNGEVNISRLYTTLAHHKGRNEHLLRHVRKAMSAGRRILALSRRLDQIEYFRKALGGDAGVVSQKMKAGERDRVFDEHQIVLATEQIAGLGLDRPELDTLFWLTPSQNVDQNVGRLLRLEGEKPKFVTDPVDDVGILIAMGKARQKRFRALGYEVRIFK